MEQFSRCLFFLSFIIICIFEIQGVSSQTVDTRSIRKCVNKAVRMVGRGNSGTIGQDSVSEYTCDN